jgi:hypothetical protein
MRATRAIPTVKRASKPKTGRELVQALRANGFIGAWKDRTDIGDSIEFAKALRERAQKRDRE